MQSANDSNSPTDGPIGNAAAKAFEFTRPRRGSPEIDAFLRGVVRLGASDLHLKAGEPPRVRLDGELRRIDREAAPNAEFEGRVLSLLSEAQQQRLLDHGSDP